GSSTGAASIASWRSGGAAGSGRGAAASSRGDQFSAAEDRYTGTKSAPSRRADSACCTTSRARTSRGLTREVYWPGPSGVGQRPNGVGEREDVVGRGGRAGADADGAALLEGAQDFVRQGSAVKPGAHGD